MTSDAAMKNAVLFERFGLPDQFVAWELRSQGKVPVGPQGHAVSAHDPCNWMSYREAISSSDRVGFVLTEQDPWFCIDLDKCDDGSGGWKEGALEIFRAFPGALYEISQSGGGLHILGKCDCVRVSRLRNKWDGWKEFYFAKRFIAFGPYGWSVIGG